VPEMKRNAVNPIINVRNFILIGTIT